MKYRMRFLFAAVAGLMALASCAEEEPVDTDRFETVALHAWMKLNRPELLENYQEEGGYYVDVRKTGDKTALPVNDTVCWVRFDFSGRDLRGNIVLTRREEDARLSGTYTKYTHYVPYYRLCGTEPLALLEGTHLAMRNTLTLGQTYYDTYKDERGFDSRELLLRPGTVVDLYMPSSVVGSGGVEGDGGYEGQYSLSAGRPMIVSMEVISTDKNPLEAEGSAVDAFCKQDGGLMLYDNTALNKRPESDEHAKHPYNIAERWVNVCDTVPQLYADFRYTPDRKLSFPQASRYKSKYMPYAQFDELEQKIADALVERFHADKPYEGVKLLRSDSVTVDGEAKIWYIGRFVDGFIFDTNIDEVKQLVYGEVASKGSALDYPGSGTISAWSYTVPHLKFGQWAAVISTSVYAYGATGVSGSRTTSGGSSSYYNSYYDYYNYYNYYNSYYGNSYYGGYYGNYYGGYYGGYYNNYYYDSGIDTDEEETQQISTEIPPYTPLIFQIYVEPAEEE